MVECQPMTEVEETEEGAGRTSATKEESQIWLDRSRILDCIDLKYTLGLCCIRHDWPLASKPLKQSLVKRRGRLFHHWIMPYVPEETFSTISIKRDRVPCFKNKLHSSRVYCITQYCNDASFHCIVSSKLLIGCSTDSGGSRGAKSGPCPPILFGHTLRQLFLCTCFAILAYWWHFFAYEWQLRP